MNGIDFIGKYRLYYVRRLQNNEMYNIINIILQTIIVYIYTVLELGERRRGLIPGRKNVEA